MKSSTRAVDNSVRYELWENTYQSLSLYCRDTIKKKCWSYIATKTRPSIHVDFCIPVKNHIADLILEENAKRGHGIWI